MQRTTPFYGIALAVLLVLPGQLSAQLDDTIIGPTGTPTRGTITRVTRHNVTITSNGSEKVFSVPEIRVLRFAGEPPELDAARKNLMEQQINDAQTDLRKIPLANIKQDLVRTDIEYYLAYCDAMLALQGTNPDKNGAAAALKKFVANPEAPNYHFFEAAEILGDLSMSMGNFADAEANYVLLTQAPGDWTVLRYRAQVLLGDSQLASAQAGKGDYQKAMASYGKVANATGTKDTAMYKQLARVGLAVCYAGTGEAGKGIALIEEIIKNEDPKETELFGKAYNALGRCYLKMQEQESDPKNKANYEKKALMAFLRTDVLFWSDRDAHAEALYHLSDLWQKANKPDRATQARTTLKRYAGSRWSQSL